MMGFADAQPILQTTTNYKLQTAKSPARCRALHSLDRRLGAGSLAVGAAEIALEGLVGLLREIGIELADTGRARDEALIGGLGVVALDLDRLLERLDAEQLLHRGAALFEGLLRIVGDLDGDRLHALG